MAALFAQCTKKALMQDKYVTLGYEQTQCADPWMNVVADSVTLKNVASYLNASGVYVGALSIKHMNSGVACLACSCKTGAIIYVTTFDNAGMKTQYQKLGFR